MNEQEIIDLENLFDCNQLIKKPYSIEKGRGALLYSAGGKEFIDCGASYGACNAGHNNELVINAIKEQMEKIVFVYASMPNSSRALFLEKLSSILPSRLNKSFLCNSGAESVEGALKLARASTGKKQIIACFKSFHGKTFGALSATHRKEYREPFEPLVPEFIHIPFDNAEKLSEAISGNTAAFIVEPVQGEGGVRVPDDNYFKEIRKICDEKGVLLIVDEIQTGFGRTGSMFAFEESGIVPDILCLAKSMANGLPFGATIANKSLFEKVPKKTITSTFSGGPVVSAAGIATIDFLKKNDIPKQAKEKGKYFIEKLNEIDSSKIREIRGKGLMIGVEIKEKVTPIISDLMDKHGVLAIPSGLTVVRFLPPLVITNEQIDKTVNAFKAVLSD